MRCYLQWCSSHVHVQTKGVVGAYKYRSRNNEVAVNKTSKQGIDILRNWRHSHYCMPSAMRIKYLLHTVSLSTQFSTLTFRSAAIDTKTAILFVISGLSREVAENCVLLGHYAASSGNLLVKFRDILSAPSSWVKNLKIILNP